MKIFIMTILTKLAAPAIIAASFFLFKKPTPVMDASTVTAVTATQSNPPPKIQAAILLDVSSSMDGLIDQAKAQLWNMVTVMGKAKCNEATPQIEIALYEYGRTGNDQNKGYVKQLSSFTTDLDMLSQKLFNLNTNGGMEYCGRAIATSVAELNWDTASVNYKVIFISGNEDFLQGAVHFEKACDAARQKGIIVNTIYCGDRMAGIQQHWNLGGECGAGSYTNINKDVQLDDMETPYDSVLFSLNEKLNHTYIAYGIGGAKRYEVQGAMDRANFTLNKSSAAKRIAVKGKKELYKNDSWDLVDGDAKDKNFMNKIDMSSLPDSLRKKSREEIKQIVKDKGEERNNIQKDIAITNAKREVYIAAERTKRDNGKNDPTLETAIEKIIRQQAEKFNMQIPN